MKLASAPLAIAVGLLSAAPLSAQPAGAVHERVFEFSPVAGVFLPDDNTSYGSGSPLLGLRATLNNSSRWALEGMLALSPGQKQTTRQGIVDSYVWHPAYNVGGQVIGVVFTDLQTREWERETDSNLFLASGSVLVHLAQERLRPFLSAGVGFIDDLSNEEGLDPPGPFSNIYWDVGVGFKYYRPSGWGVRLDIHDYVMRRDDLPQPNARAPLLAAQRDLFTGGGANGEIGTEPYFPDDYRARRWLNNYAVSVSLTIPLGWAWKDGDGDTIEDRFDRCLTTAPSVVVDDVGCGIDSDEDGIFDGLDHCEGTPVGATVDLQGCPSDTDGDEILDGIDQCADTPVGALVNAVGCPSDADGDGVLDGLDLCNSTPLGAAIDDKGCVLDPLEAKLLLGEMILLREVQFDSGRPDLTPLSFHYVNKVGRLLERWTGNDDRPLRIEIGVHTDGVGATDYNLDLSQRRAESVRLYLLESFHQMGQNNLAAVGYGESTPIADDATAAGRLANRRVEIRLRGPGEPPEAFTPGRDAGLLEPGVEDEIPELPDLDIPDLQMPDLEMPDLEMPEEPEMPDAE